MLSSYTIKGTEAQKGQVMFYEQSSNHLLLDF